MLACCPSVSFGGNIEPSECSVGHLTRTLGERGWLKKKKKKLYKYELYIHIYTDICKQLWLKIHEEEKLSKTNKLREKSWHAVMSVKDGPP